MFGFLTGPTSSNGTSGHILNLRLCDGLWSPTVGPDAFHWTGLVYFVAQAWDAGGNMATAENLNGRWFVTGVQAAASADPSTGTAPLKVTFDGGAEGVRGPFMYAWDFGDGSDKAAGVDVSHSYGKAGTFTVTLTVTDEGGHSANATVTVKVDASAEQAKASGCGCTTTEGNAAMLLPALLALLLLSRRRFDAA